MTRKPRRHALSVPVRSGSEVGFPQSLGEVHDMLYDKSLERDNCGFGLIAHIEGEPSHKVVRTAIHALARMQHRGAILADGKPATVAACCYKNRIAFFASLRRSAAGV
ncbi:glutamate synthase subunit alpha [Escherichia coli]|uniref:Glutamate synthase subunit alpha n=1 Tax=Escherichia coli TaxID=562 RepID=A0A377AFZ7_ECOLX|nr:glutamate synthase subunit alpha [Escherichia coli]